jgi:hypothetical protein
MTRVHAIVGVLAIALPWQLHAQGSEDTPAAPPGDCGALALYHVLSLEGRRTNLDRIESALGALTPDGHSFLEIRAAARRLGLRLDAVVVRRERLQISGPTLAFVKSGQHGHFIVVRPVGHTGRLLQILDGYRDPLVVDADRLFASDAWTGLGLVPHKPNYLVVAAGALSAACLAALGLRQWNRGRRPSCGVSPAI